MVSNTTDAGYVFVPQTPEVFAHDLDGNLIRDGRWTNVWDAENRLTKVEPIFPATNDKKAEFTYDYMGRRVRKTVSTYSGGQWTEDSGGDQLFVYEQWNVALVLNANASNATVNLGGIFTLANLGVFNRSLGTVNLTGSIAWGVYEAATGQGLPFVSAIDLFHHLGIVCGDNDLFR